MRYNLLVGIVMLYLLACLWPEVKGVSPPGIAYLIALPMAMFVLAWWANPLFFAGCVALARGNTWLACGLGVVATILASTFFAGLYPKQGLSVFRVPCADLWLLSMVGLAASGFLKPQKAVAPEKPCPIDEL